MLDRYSNHYGLIAVPYNPYVEIVIPVSTGWYLEVWAEEVVKFRQTRAGGLVIWRRIPGIKKGLPHSHRHTHLHACTHM